MSSERTNPKALLNVLPLLERLDAAFGTRSLADLLGVGSGTVTNRKRRRHPISPEYAERVIELHAIVMHALRLHRPRTVTDWLVGHDPFLDDARPIDVLAEYGAAPLIGALDAFEALGYA